MSRTRYSLQYLQSEYDNGNRGPLEKLLRAFIGIQAKPIDDPLSFFVLAGYHGEPFHGAGASDGNLWWGGYCNHGNVLFPTWHRAYVLRLEDALRSVQGCEDVTMAFWDEYLGYGGDPSKPGPPNPIPAVLTSPTIELDGKPQPNPLYSYRLPKVLVDSINKDENHRYDKNSGYSTVRFPYSGLVGTEEDRNNTNAWNSKFDEPKANGLLNGNVSNWLNQGIVVPDDGSGARHPDTFSVGARYARCLDAPNYMVFTNTTSAGQWSSDHGLEADVVVPLESPHNAMHLAVGGFFQKGVYEADPADYEGANGDMGENNTASFDPIFFFHHCFVDYVLWCYQKKHNLTEPGSLSVEFGYAGTNSSDIGTSPSAYQQANVFLDMDSPLYPFKKKDGSWCTSKDVTNIKDQLDYVYGPGSLDPLVAGTPLEAVRPEKPAAIKKITGINRRDYKGSFVIRTQAIGKDGTPYDVGREEVLSRWNITGCRNCQTHLNVTTLVPVHQPVLHKLVGSDGAESDIKYVVKIQTHDGLKEVDAQIGDL